MRRAHATCVARRRSILSLLPLAITVAVLGIVASSGAAWGDVSQDACVDANTSAQKLRAAGSFAVAREKLRTCSDPTCPGIVRNDCIQRLDELDRAQPTIVLDVKDAAGNDMAAVRVTVDGQLLASRLTGAAVRVDPGERSFTFEAEGKAPVTRKLIIKEGEKDRRERIVLADAGAALAAPAPPLPGGAPDSAGSPPESPPSGGGMGTQRMLGLVAGGAGIAGIAAGSVFGLLASSANSAQKNDCASATSCANRSQAQSDHSTLETDGTISTVAFIAGGVLLAAGAVLFFTAGGALPAPTTGLVVVPSVGTAGGGVSVRTEF